MSSSASFSGHHPLRGNTYSWLLHFFPWRTRWNAPVVACELQPLGVRRLFAWAIALVVVQRRLHMVSDAKAATRCRGGTALYAFPFLSATKLPFTLARYFQIRKFIYNASHSITSRFGWLAVYEVERFVNFFLCSPATIL
jgi:hypothetical protein